ncbi:TonB system transport protein ExbD [Luteimonas deserti]|uniref:Biopolymer transport protein ExbD n=1 Tax=Luteimonas deserti TaxID=2752306 RepID=A0A7Z0QVV3_9GAMM|nr:TonB system transport protein ExbD [Luteimonas deserti]NYZ64263.1 TonB system transport protein ExbD [Luteimonas deserti]
MAIRTAADDADDLDALHEINVTPFIDVMLVLLIIFMVAAPLATVDLPVELPANAAPPQPREREPLFITVQADLRISVNEQPVARAAIGPTLNALTGGDRDERLFLRADRSVAYGELMETMNALRDAGYTKVALVGVERPPG